MKNQKNRTIRSALRMLWKGTTPIVVQKFFNLTDKQMKQLTTAPSAKETLQSIAELRGVISRCKLTFSLNPAYQLREKLETGGKRFWATEREMLDYLQRHTNGRFEIDNTGEESFFVPLKLL